MNLIRFIILVSFFIGLCAYALPQKSGANMSFKYSFGTEALTVQVKATSFEEALPKVAQQCFDHFKKGKKLTEELGLDIIDVCANPKVLN